MKYPVVIVKPNEAPLYFFKEGYLGLVSKGGESFYRNGTLYDSAGCIFTVNGIESIKKAPFLKSLKYFQQMYVVKIKLTLKEKVSLIQFKDLFIKHLNYFSSYWIKRDVISSLEKSILIKEEFSDIITLLE